MVRPNSWACSTMIDRPAVSIRPDQQFIANLVAPGARVLDVGCDDGALLDYLVHEKQVDGRGIELSPEKVGTCFRRGLSVVQGDAETDLSDYPDDSFDYAILSQTLQTIDNISGVLDHLLRIGRRAVVSFPNFGHWRVRWRLLAGGRAPATPALPYDWFDTPNIRICSFADLLTYCEHNHIAVERIIAIGADGRALGGRTRRAGKFYTWMANVCATEGVLLISRD